MFCYRVRKYIAAYLTVLNGANAVLFGCGIGENAPEVRARIGIKMDWCGLRLDTARNTTVAHLLALAQEELVSPEERATSEGKQALVGVVSESR